MAFREVSVIEIREVLRLWLRGYGLRRTTALTGLDRKTVRRYVDAALDAGLLRDGGEHQLTDELIGSVCETVRPSRPDGHGESWELLSRQREKIKGWIEQELTLVKIHRLLTRDGVVVPYRTLHRFAVAQLGFGRRAATMRVADGEPGQEVQVDFGRMGLMPDPTSGRRRVCHALVVTACYSRHTFVWLTFRQTTEAVIAGFEEAWRFFNGVFPVVIPDNLSPVVVKADPVDPRFNDTFLEYAQVRGFVVDAARVGHPKDKPRVERSVQYVRKSFYAGEDFRDLVDGQGRAARWCLEEAGMRIHGTTQARPLEVFRDEEAPRLLPRPAGVYVVPVHARAKVHRDHHIEVAKALYSVPGNRIGQHVDARADAALVKVYQHGQLIKVHPRMPAGKRSTDRADLPAERTVYALRDVEQLKRMALQHGDHVGRYAAALLDSPLPWTRMRQVYRLLGQARRFGSGRVNDACRAALEVDTVNVGFVGRLLERAAEGATAPSGRRRAVRGRFVRDASEFAVGRGRS